MATNNDMREQLKSLETKFDGLETKFDGLETKFGGLETKFGGLETKFGGLETKFDGLEAKFGSLETKFGGLEKKVGSLETKFDGLEEKVDQLPTAADFTRLTDKVTILIEDAKTAVKNAADGYKGTLERIERDLGDLNKKVDVKFSDHDKVLSDHNKRITVLEAPRRPSSGGV